MDTSWKPREDLSVLLLLGRSWPWSPHIWLLRFLRLSYFNFSIVFIPIHSQLQTSAAQLFILRLHSVSSLVFTSTHAFRFGPLGRHSWSLSSFAYSRTRHRDTPIIVSRFLSRIL